MPMRALFSLGMCVAAAALQLPASTGRRNVLRKAVLASTTTALPALLPVLPAGADSSVSDMAPFRPEAEFAIDRVVSEAELYNGLETSPPRVVVLTGASSGIGFAAAKLLTAAGHTVICACRTQAKADTTARACLQYAADNTKRAGGTARGMECNLADLNSVRAFARQLIGTPIDTLALNAGLALNTGDKAAQRTADGFELTVGTNHLGHFLLANLLIPQVEKSAKPRIVVTASSVHDPSSGGGKQGSPASLGDLSGLASGAKFEMVDGGAFDPDKAYKDSKLCNMMFTAEAARRFGAAGVPVVSLSPGLIANPDGFFRYQNKLFARAFDFISRTLGVAETVEFGGSGVAYLAVAPLDDKLNGAFFDNFPPGKHQLAVHAPSIEARDEAKQRKLWDLSCKLTGLA